MLDLDLLHEHETQEPAGTATPAGANAAPDGPAYAPAAMPHLADYMRLLLESASEGIYGVDTHDRCTFINPAAARMLGYQAEEVLGQPMHARIHHSYPDGSPYPHEQCPVYRAYRFGESCRLESEVLWRRDGTAFPVEYATGPIVENGAIKGAVVIFSDITDRKRLEEERARLLERERAARAEAESAQQRLVALAVARDRVMAEVELINAILTTAAGEQDLERILAIALDQLSTMLTFTGGSIALVEGDELVVRAAIGPFAATALGQRLPRGRGRSWQIIESGEPFLCNDLIAAGIKTRSADAEKSIRSYLAVPLIWRDQIFGLLEIDSTVPDAFQPADLALMRSVAQALCGPIELARRYAEQVQAREHMEQLARQKDELLEARDRALAEAEIAARRLALLAEASTLIASSLDYKATLASVARLVVPRMADWCAVDVLEEDGSLQRLAVAHVDPAKIELARDLQQRSAAHTASDLPEVLRTGRPLLIAEITDDLLVAIGYDADQLRLVRELGLRSVMVVPLQARGRVLGAITFAMAESGRRYGPADVALAEDLARRAGLAIDNARLYEAEQRARAAAEAAIQARDQFLSIASHELKTPLTSLLGYAELLQRRTMREGTLSERDRRAVQVIVEQAMRLNRMVASLLDLSRIETGQLSIERAPVDLRGLARRVVEEMQLTLDRHPITIHIPDQPVLIMGDELRLEQVLQNLISNAIKYSPEGSPITVQVEQYDAQARVAVTDRGIGIPAEALSRLFQRFYRASNVDPQSSGMGLGLYVVKEIVALHGGEVHVTSREGEGSTFTVCLPLMADRQDRD